MIGESGAELEFAPNYCANDPIESAALSAFSACYPGTSYDIREAGELRLAEVHVQDGETLESALRRFKRKVQTEDIIKEIKRHSFYLKPGEKKRTKEALARKRNRKKRTRDTE